MAEWMAFNPADYVSNTMHLTTRQHGGYILLICAAWAGKGILPGTDAGLASIAKLLPREWREDGDALKAFLTRRGEVWVHERVEFEWQDAHALIAAKSKAGKEGARKRWHGRANGNAIADPSPSQGQTDAPQPLPEPCSEAKASGAKAPARDVIFAECLPWLEKRSGKNCRALVGKWLSEIRDDDAIRQLLEDAERENPMDPVSWITVRLKPKEPHETWDQRRIREGMAVLREYENDRH